jgi:cytochrome d ubiquinol oxidase subunit I
MLAVGFTMIGAGLVGVWLWWRGRLFTTHWYLAGAARCWWMGFVAIIAGWVVTESGRQPWIVHGIQRTADAVSPVPAATVASTLALFVLVYGVVFSAGIYFINRLINRGPAPSDKPGAEPRGAGSRPLAAAKPAGGEATAEGG